MSRRALLACGGLWVAVFLIGADIGFGAEPGYGAPAADSQSPTAIRIGAGPVQIPDSGGDELVYTAERRLDSSPADGLSRPSAVSYQYDALGRIKEIVRVPGK
jgi:hypothetical protein